VVLFSPITPRQALCCALLLASCTLVHGGQSIALSSEVVRNDVIAAQPENGPCRMEWSFHDWDLNAPSTSLVRPEACGLDVRLLNLNGELRLQVYNKRSRGATYGACLFSLARLPARFATVRYQHIPRERGGTDTCEVWDIQGQRFFVDIRDYDSTTSDRNRAGVQLTGAGTQVSTAYFRLFDTTVPLGWRPPVTADTGNLVEWKFDGNLQDSSQGARH
jgi:hypothetical protein